MKSEYRALKEKSSKVEELLSSDRDKRDKILACSNHFSSELPPTQAKVKHLEELLDQSGTDPSKFFSSPLSRMRSGMQLKLS